MRVRQQERAMSSFLESAHPAVRALRTLALVGASASGKTTLAEALLHKAGAISAAGSVERGSTVSDFDPLERRAQHSLSSALVHLQHGDTCIQMMDTPGAPDFLGQSLPVLEAVDTAALVVSASAGLEPMSGRLMAWATGRGLCRMVIINKIDAAGIDLPGLLAALQAAFGKVCLPLNLPAAGGTRVVDCFFNQTGVSDFSSVSAAHRALVEQVVEVDPALVERYLDDGDMDPRALHAPLEQALREGHLIPVCFVSARSGAGVAELLEVMVRLLPSPAEGNPPPFLRGEGASAVPVRALPEAGLHVLAHVFKLRLDPYLGRMGMVRVHQGTLSVGMQLYVGDGRRPVKIGHLYRLQGRDHTEITRAGPGELCAVAKIDEIHFDAVLHDAPEDEHMHLKRLDFPVPVHGLAIEPRRRGDEQRLWDLVQRLVDEDPCLQLEHVAATHETVVYGLGELHLRALLERLSDVYKCEVDTRPPRIAYRETVTLAAQGHHRHKKQSGGAGQFGEVFLRIEPLARGAGIEFVDQVKGGTIPGQYMAAVEKGVRQAIDGGVLAGFPLHDLRVVVHDGKHHSVDSKDIAFATAGRKALIEAVRAASPVVLEPVVHVEITAPEAFTGDITGDLSARRGQVSGTRSLQAGTLAVLGQVPLSELSGYSSRLNALTGGQGSYTRSFSHYEAVPPAVQQQLAGQYRLHEEE
jgi:elongation factor G